ncbi:MAG: nucleotidyltransferase domain-containing protein, partial [Bacteroidota bacterium]
MDQLSQLIDKHFPECPVLLAGSHAIGKETSDSDIDLLIFTDAVQTPVITLQEINGLKIEAIEIPKQNALYFLERTAVDSGAYLFMLAMGRIIRDVNGYLADLKKWGDQRFLEGPPEEGRGHKTNRIV